MIEDYHDKNLDNNDLWAIQILKDMCDILGGREVAAIFQVSQGRISQMKKMGDWPFKRTKKFINEISGHRSHPLTIPTLVELANYLFADAGLRHYTIETLQPTTNNYFESHANALQEFSKMIHQSSENLRDGQIDSRESHKEQMACLQLIDELIKHIELLKSFETKEEEET